MLQPKTIIPATLGFLIPFFRIAHRLTAKRLKKIVGLETRPSPLAQNDNLRPKLLPLLRFVAKKKNENFNPLITGVFRELTPR